MFILFTNTSLLKKCRFFPFLILMSLLLNIYFYLEGDENREESDEVVPSSQPESQDEAELLPKVVLGARVDELLSRAGKLSLCIVYISKCLFFPFSNCLFFPKSGLCEF